MGSALTVSQRWVSSSVRFDYEASPYRTECSFDSLYVGAVLCVQEPADCGLADAEAVAEGYVRDALAAHSGVQLQLCSDDRRNGD